AQESRHDSKQLRSKRPFPVPKLPRYGISKSRKLGVANTETCNLEKRKTSGTSCSSTSRWTRCSEARKIFLASDSQTQQTLKKNLKNFDLPRLFNIRFAAVIGQTI